MVDNNEISAAFRRQAEICRHFGSPFYSELLLRMVRDLAGPGPMRELLADWHESALRAALPLRVMGAVHRLVLSGEAEDLALFYRGDLSSQSAESAWPVFRDLVGDRRKQLQVCIQQPPQTNEVGRSAAFLSGMLRAACEYALPLSLLEIGSSAGLNLFWDRYRYDFGVGLWGNAASPVCIRSHGKGSPPVEVEGLRVLSRRGCDLHPIDLEDADARLALESYVWADQPGRLATLRAAIALLRDEAVQVEASSASDWVAARLSGVAVDVTTILYHSVMWAYMDDQEQHALENCIIAAGRTRDASAPLIWLSLEDSVDRYRDVPKLCLRYRSWPSGVDCILAYANPHGTWVHWLDD